MRYTCAECGEILASPRIILIRGSFTRRFDSFACFAKYEAYVCTSDDPKNHQGDTCPIHEGAQS